MFKVVESLTNVKPPKSTTPELETAPTPGQFRLNPAGATLLGVIAGDYLAIVRAKEEIAGEEVTSTFLTVGYEGGENEGNFGSKLGAVSSTGSGTLNLSASNAWATLEGNTDNKRVYNINPEAIVDGDAKYFRIEFSHSIDKQERKASAEA